jgi:hypothetical protein
MSRLHDAARDLLASFRPGAGAPEADRLIGKLAAAGEWEPFLFVDAVEAQVLGRGSDGARALLEELQHLEMAVLLKYCLERV